MYNKNDCCNESSTVHLLKHSTLHNAGMMAKNTISEEISGTDTYRNILIFRSKLRHQVQKTAK